MAEVASGHEINNPTIQANPIIQTPTTKETPLKEHDESGIFVKLTKRLLESDEKIQILTTEKETLLEQHRQLTEDNKILLRDFETLLEEVTKLRQENTALRQENERLDVKVEKLVKKFVPPEQTMVTARACLNGKLGNGCPNMLSLDWPHPYCAECSRKYKAYVRSNLVQTKSPAPKKLHLCPLCDKNIESPSAKICNDCRNDRGVSKKRKLNHLDEN